ncbi:MAG: hypothetical protein AAF587_32175 [Bacteroidota bacterium]
MKKILLVIGLSLIWGPLTYAQTTWEKALEEMEQRIERKKQDQQDRLDLRFSNQMRRLWIQMALEKSPDAPGMPDPDNPTIFDPSSSLFPLDQEITVLPPLRNEPEQREDHTVSRMPRQELAPVPDDIREDMSRKLTRQVQADYFGSYMDLRYDAKMEFSLGSRITEDRIADLWENLEKTDHELLLYQLVRKSRTMNLNDWGFCQLLNTLAKEIYPRDKNARVMFCWFFLSKAGYISTVSYDNSNLYLMLPSKQVLYGKTYMNGKQHKLYAIDLDGESLELNRSKVFKQKYPEANRVLDFRIDRAPSFSRQAIRKNLSFSYYGERYTIPVELNRNVIEFYQTYPFVDLEIYLGAPLSEEARKSLVPPLREIMNQIEPRDGRSREAENVNFLLRFSQTALAYKSDRDQFGGEKYLFADETLYYPYSDCEDRSVLFAYLVKEILGYEVVGLLYPGHAATAVRIPGPAKGDFITHNGKRYYVCDPTYINASYGMSLPDVRGQMARVIKF